MTITSRIKSAARNTKLLYFLNIIVCAFWLFLRSGLRPSRLRYPCQQYAFAQISTVPVISLVFNTKLNKKRIGLVVILVFALVNICWLLVSNIIQKQKTASQYPVVPGQNLCIDYQLIDNGHSRVVEIYDSSASDYNRSHHSDPYFNHIDQDRVNHMFEEGVKHYTNQTGLVQAMNTIIPDYQVGKAVAIKVNGNDFVHSLGVSDEVRKKYYTTEPQTVRAVIRGLLAIGVRQEDVWIVEGTGEGSRDFPVYYKNLIKGSDYLDIQFKRWGHDCQNGRINYTYANRRCDYSCLSQPLVDASYFIDIPIVKAIRTKWGVTGAIKSTMGMINNQYCHHDPSWNQSNFEPLDIDNTTNPLVSIYQNPNIVGKKRLIVASGIIGNWTGFHFEGAGEVTSNNIPNPFAIKGNKPLNTLLIAQDPVAIDSVALNLLLQERTARNLNCVYAPQLLAAARAELGTLELFSGGVGEYQSIDHRLVKNWILDPTTTPEIDTCPEDVNKDGYIRLNDINMIINYEQWNDQCVPGTACPEDVNGDGWVRLNDVNMIINHIQWNDQCS